MKQFKYVVFDEGYGEIIMLFPDLISHADFVQRYGIDSRKLISAGMVMDGKCCGESVGLGLRSRKPNDTVLLKSYLEEEY